jgi:membrane-associated phospholipid phosphatase
MAFPWKKQKEGTPQEYCLTYEAPAGSLWIYWTAFGLSVAALIPVKFFNVALFMLFNECHSPYTDMFWLGFTTLGDGFLLGLILGAFLLVNPRITCIGLFLLILSSLLIHTGKFLFPMPRPAGMFSSTHVMGPLLKSGAFPSGHTAASFSTALTLAYFLRSRIAACVALGLALLVSVSRICVGAHFPFDIIGGIVCALGAFLMVRLFLWDRLASRIPCRPALSSRNFRIALAVEGVGLVVAGAVYAPRWAELPVSAWAITAGVFMFMAFQLKKILSK